MRQRLERFGVSIGMSLASTEEEGLLARSLQHLIRSKPTVLLVASTTAPAGPDRRGRPSPAERRLPHRAFPGARRAGQPAAAGLQGRCPDYLRSGVLPVHQTERRGLVAGAPAGEVPHLGLGGGQPGKRRATGLTKGFLHPLGAVPRGRLEGACRASADARHFFAHTTAGPDGFLLSSGVPLPAMLHTSFDQPYKLGRKTVTRPLRDPFRNPLHARRHD